MAVNAFAADEAYVVQCKNVVDNLVVFAFLVSARFGQLLRSFLLSLLLSILHFLLAFAVLPVQLFLAHRHTVFGNQPAVLVVGLWPSENLIDLYFLVLRLAR